MSAASSAVAAATTAAAEGSLSSRDISAQSSPVAVSLIQAEQAVGEGERRRATGAGPTC